MMKKKALWRSIFREILESKARFLSILGIILLGVSFYVGIKATGPIMTKTAADYYSELQLMDTKIVSTLGLTDGDLNLLNQDEGIDDYQAWYRLDLNISNLNRVVRFYSYNPEAKNQLNQFAVIKGRLPVKTGEIALDRLALTHDDFKIGDTYTIEGDKKELEKLKATSFKIVGFVNSPMFIENVSRGNTTVGKGAVDYFAVLPQREFNLAAYSEIYVRYKNLLGIEAYSDDYQDRLEKNLKATKIAFKNRPKERLAEIQQAAQPELDDAQKKIDEGEKALQEGESQLEKALNELNHGRTALANGETTYANEIAEAEWTLSENSQQLASGKEELILQEQALARALVALEQGERELAAARQQLVEQGIDPDLDPSLIEGQIAQLSNYESILTAQLAQVVASIEQIPDGELISSPEVEGVIGTLLDLINTTPELDLAELGLTQADISKLVAEITETEMTPALRAELKAQAVTIQNEINKLPGLAAPLHELVAGLRAYQEGQAAYENGRSQYASGKAQISLAKTQLAEGESQLAQGYVDLEQARTNGETQLAEARQKIIDGERELSEGQKKIANEKEKLAKAKKELAKAVKELAEIPLPDYLYFDRDDNPGYAEYHENAKRISSIATVFPVFFFLIAALVSLTTMTRMVDEKRGEIGTLKALGYRNSEIALKYIVYATMASLIGTGLGLLVGFNVFPLIIIDAYGALYNLPAAASTYFLNYSIQSLGVALLCTLMSALLVLRFDLLSAPATLMRPKAPKAGQRILLERLTFIWRRLSFNQKVTARNLFRYKQRMFMTVFGIAGCMALIITGFGLRDSISDVVALQFDKLWHYQGIVTYQDNTSVTDLKAYEETVMTQPKLKERLVLSQEAMRVMAKGKTTQTVTIDVPQVTAELNEFVLFNDRRSGEVFELTDEGAIINEKLAKIFQLQVGDSFEVTNNDDRRHQLKVAAIVENYAMHYIYLSPTYYGQVFGKQPDYNSELLLFKDKLTKAEEEQIATNLMAEKQVINVSFLSGMSDGMDSTIDSLNIVVWLLIVSAAMLAFIVLYNLTNINISERIRELSTIKVLGFYPKEVTQYVYRENNILTLLGISVGGFLGTLLHGFVLQTAEVDILMFSPTIHWQSYVYSALLTACFSYLVMLVMHRKLKRVDMISALKSTE